MTEEPAIKQQPRRDTWVPSSNRLAFTDKVQSRKFGKAEPLRSMASSSTQFGEREVPDERLD